MVETTLRKTPDSKHKIELHSIAPEPPITVGGSWDFKKSGVIARGAKWEFAPPDLNVDAMPYELNEVQFVDASNGWICGDRGYVLRSTDGGATWQQKRYGRIYDHLPSVIG